MRPIERLADFLAIFYDRHTGRLRRLGLLLLCLVVIALLLPLLLFPLGPDNALFFLSGQMIVEEGAIHYVDIVDVKPPAIYYLNALAVGLFGPEAWSMRLLDVVLQLAALTGLFVLLRRITGRDLEGVIAVVLWPLCYLGLNNANTTQTESFLLLLLVPAMLLFFYRRTAGGYAFVGLLCGIAALLKFTFAIVIVPFLLADLLLYREPLKNRLLLWGALVGGAMTAGVLLVTYLSIFDAWSGFNEMRQWTAGYTGMQFESIGTFLRETVKKVPTHLADEYSLVMLFATLVALGRGWVGRRAGFQERTDRTGPLLFLAGLLFLALLSSVALEGKWVHYHVSRLFAPGVILAAFGIPMLVAGFRRIENRGIRVGVAGLALLLVIAFSPLSRYIFHVRPALLLATSGSSAFDDYYAHAHTEESWRLEEIHDLGDKLGEAIGEEDEIFISSGVGALLYLRIGALPPTPIFHSGFLIGDHAPSVWIDRTKRYLLEHPPRFLLIHRTARMRLITGNDRTSLETIGSWPRVRAKIIADYQPVEMTNSFLLLERADQLEKSTFARIDSIDVTTMLRPQVQ